MGLIENAASFIKKTFTSPTIEKAIGAGYSTVPTVLPQGYDFQSGTRFLNFLELETLEDGPKRIVVKSSYLQNSWVYSAIQVMATNFAQAEFKVMRGEGDAATQVIRTDNQYGWVPYLFDYVSPTENKYSLWESLLVWLSMNGECFWHLKRSTANIVSELDVIPPMQMEHVLLNGRLAGWKRNNGSTTEAIPIEDILHFKYFNPYSKYRGISPLTAAALGIHVDLAASLYNYFFFQNDATPNLVISTDQDVNEEKAQTLRHRWLKQYGGYTKKGIPAFLGSGTKPIQLALAQKDIMYIEQKKWSREEVFAVLNVPPALSQVLEFASIKSNIKEQRQQLFENNLIPKMWFISAVLKTDFFDREGMKDLQSEFDTTGISALKDTIAEKIPTARELFNMGVPFNEINDKLQFGFEPLPWGDQGYIPMAMVPADGENEPTKPEKPPTTPQDDGEPEEPPAKKSIIVKKRQMPVRYANRVLDSVSKQETELREKLKDFYHKMGSDVLNRVYSHKSVKATLDPALNDILPADEDYDRLIVELATPIYLQVIEIAVEGLSKSLGTNVSLATIRQQQIIAWKSVKLQEVNDTIREQIIADTREIVAEALKTGRSYQDVADILAQDVKNIFKNVRRRTETVARTEINGTLQMSRSEGMKQVGVEEIQWISTRMIRPSHILNHLEHRLFYVEKFPSGIYEPYDPDAPPEEVINCACISTEYRFEE